jgi:hypothetical protein
VADLLKIIGTVFSTASILTGLIFLKKANESIDYLIGASLIVLGILIGTVFFFFANMLLNSEKQTTLLREAYLTSFNLENWKILKKSIFLFT